METGSDSEGPVIGCGRAFVDMSQIKRNSWRERNEGYICTFNIRNRFVSLCKEGEDFYDKSEYSRQVPKILKSCGHIC